jgi:hypothetical protein
VALKARVGSTETDHRYVSGGSARGGGKKIITAIQMANASHRALPTFSTVSGDHSHAIGSK